MRFYKFETRDGEVHVDLDAIFAVRESRNFVGYALIVVASGTLDVRMPVADVLALVQAGRDPSQLPPMQATPETPPADSAANLDGPWNPLDMADASKLTSDQRTAVIDELMFILTHRGIRNPETVFGYAANRLKELQRVEKLTRTVSGRGWEKEAERVAAPSPFPPPWNDDPQIAKSIAEAPLTPTGAELVRQARLDEMERLDKAANKAFGDLRGAWLAEYIRLRREELGQ